MNCGFHLQLGWLEFNDQRIKLDFMKQNVARGIASLCFLAACTSFPIEAQQRPASAQEPTMRVQSSLVLVDVINQDPKSGLPVRDFKKEDF